MKPLALCIAILTTFISATTCAQAQYNGTYEAGANERIGIMSTLTISNDSFELVYTWAPDRFVHNVSAPPHPVALHGIANINPDAGKHIKGATTKVYKGRWQVANTTQYREQGYDFIHVHDVSRDSMATTTQHINVDDGDRLVFTCTDGTIFHCIITPGYYSVPAIFVDNMLGDIYLKQQNK